jgi:sterol desaturase/sphingolipid hydroxylase (fatty acid hydroxylase superfamily)
MLFLEFGFYWAHRFLHHPLLYARLHKQHHEYKGPIGFAAEYATVGEQVRCCREAPLPPPLARV